ncbi:AsnC family protein [Klebsiella quasipneumoniae]|nr:AsnC family protein [Klebsiella quasipneumoniae]
MLMKARGVKGKAPSHIRAWTKEEDALLVMLYAVHTAKEVAQRMGRPLGGIKKRLEILRETHPDLLRKHRPFTDEEEQFIRQNCKRMTVSLVANLLHRTRGDVTQKALRMNVSFFKCGDAHHSTRISDDDVLLIRALRDDEQGEKLTFSEIAEKFDISRHAAWRAYNLRLTTDDRVSRELLSK